MQTKFADLQIKIARGQKSSMRICKNEQLSWMELCTELSTPTHSSETLSEFLTLQEFEQTNLKKEAGWILGGEINGTLRNNGAMKSRTLISFDCDTNTAELFASIKNKSNPICKFEFFWHTTRKHTPENPRMRIYIPVSKPIPAEEFEAVSRIVAQIVDEKMVSIDRISFLKSQLMFNPTCSNGQEFEKGLNQGDLINPEQILADFGIGWKDRNNLPCASHEELPNTFGDEVGCPKSKTGVIGAFCRAYYPITKAIEAFIPEIYIIGQSYTTQPRYTYKPGETANGVIIHNEGRFIFSFHGTDPAAERVYNAFDMIRIHKFGHLDVNVALKKDYRTWPSFRAMLAWARHLPEVQGELVAGKIDFPAIMDDADKNRSAADHPFLANPPPAPESVADCAFLTGEKTTKKPARNRKKDAELLKKELEIDNKNNIAATQTNIRLIIENDPRIGGAIGRNEFSNKIVVRHDIRTTLLGIPPIEVDDRKNGDDWTDLMDLTVQAMLDYPAGNKKPGWGIHTSRAMITGAIRIVAENNKFHPVKDYLDGLKWDGVKRIDKLFTEYLGVPDTPYYREAGRLILLASICRVIYPGYKWDYAPILEGPQGVRKSTFIKILYSEEWFGELTAQMVSDKNAVEQMLGKWGMELPELANMRTQETEVIKGFITRQQDEVRLTYDRRMSKFKRQCVYWGTTNSRVYLKDRSGNRRFWPLKVMVELIDTDKLMTMRNPLWAEAWHEFQVLLKAAGRVEFIKLELSPEARAEAENLQELVREEDSSETSIHYVLKFLDTQIPLGVLLSDETLAGNDNPIVERVITSPVGIAEGLGFDEQRILTDPRIIKNITDSLQMIDHWDKDKTGKRQAVFGKRSRKYLRNDATDDEIAQGYRIVANATDQNADIDGEIPF